MLNSFSLIRESFVLGGGGFHRVAVQLILFNLVVTSVTLGLVFGFGRISADVNLLDVAIEGGSTLVHFFTYCVIASVALKRWIKRQITHGLLLTQLGVMLDMLDEFVVLHSDAWHLAGDTAYLLGALLVLYGTSNWIVYTYRISTLDKLTNVHNRRFFEAMLKQYLLRLQRLPEPACLLSMDLDNFKHINDQYGHSMGDSVLQIVAHVLKNNARKADVICRSGGEEFEMLLADATPEQAKSVAQRILQDMSEQTPTDLPDLSASVGVTAIAVEDSIDTLRNRADKGMYQAKKDGKGKVVVL